jgi:hypothetical protein
VPEVPQKGTGCLSSLARIRYRWRLLRDDRGMTAAAVLSRLLERGPRRSMMRIPRISTKTFEK